MGPRTRFRVAVVALLLLAASSQLPVCHTANFEREFILIDGDASYRIYLSVTDALYAYYQGKEHRQTVSNLPTFVTPYALAPVADDIRSLFPEDEAVFHIEVEGAVSLIPAVEDVGALDHLVPPPALSVDVRDISVICHRSAR